MSRRRKLLAAAAGITGAAGFAFVAGGHARSAPRWGGPAGPNFDGRRFRSIEPLDHGFSDFLRWMTHRERSPWRSFTATPPGRRPPERVGDGKLRMTFVNHST